MSKHLNSDKPNSIVRLLKDVFKLDKFASSLQEKAVKAICEENNVFLSMLLGAERFLCFALPALYFDKVTIVISPSIELISYHMQHLNTLNIKARAIHAKQSEIEHNQVINDLVSCQPHCCLLFVTPEQTTTGVFNNALTELIEKSLVALFVVDGADYIFDYGYSLRPVNLQLGKLRQKLKVPCIALTAAPATPAIKRNVFTSLHLNESTVVLLSSKYCQNIYLDVEYKHLLKSPYDNLKQFIETALNISSGDKTKHERGIIYCQKQVDCELLAEELNRRKFNVKPLHEGINAKDCFSIVKQWSKGNVLIIVASSKFEFIIDSKVDVRFVAFWTIPKSLSRLYILSSIAGRYGRQSICRLYYSVEDEILINTLMEKDLREFNENKKGNQFEEDFKNYMKDLKESFENVVELCKERKCRHIAIASFVGESLLNCRLSCDFCNPNSAKKDSRDIVLSNFDQAQTPTTFFGYRDSWSLEDVPFAGKRQNITKPAESEVEEIEKLTSKRSSVQFTGQRKRKHGDANSVENIKNDDISSESSPNNSAKKKSHSIKGVSKKVEMSKERLDSYYISPDVVTIDISKTGFLGSGGSGSVKIGLTGKFGIVAVKAIPLAGDPREIESGAEQVRREIGLMLRFNHKNIIEFVGWSKWNDNVAILMKYMPGGNLRGLMKFRCKDRKLLEIPYALRLRLCLDICNGVAYLHYEFGNERVVHGDIKPANILLSENLECKIGDFGSSRLSTISEKISRPRSRDDKAAYTRGYVDPKFLDSDERFSKAMDLYSVGATFYMILQRKDPPKQIFKFHLDALSCSDKNFASDEAHFDFIRDTVWQCCEPTYSKRIDAKKLGDWLRAHFMSCDDCSTRNVLHDVDSIKKVYSINTRTTEFSQSKILSATSLKDFAYNVSL